MISWGIITDKRSFCLCDILLHLSARELVSIHAASYVGHKLYLTVQNITCKADVFVLYCPSFCIFFVDVKGHVFHELSFQVI